MPNDLTVYEAGTAVAKAKKEDYVITVPFTGHQTTLKRNVDFGVIPNTKQPSLFKAGAQKIANAFGLLQHFTVESAIEDIKGEVPVFFYRIRCDLIKIAQDGTEYVFSSGHGSANTMESRNGRSSAWNSANATLKMAEKRALTAAVLSVSGLADLFTQDMENEDFMGQEINIVKDDDVISKKQMKYLYATASSFNLTTEDAKNIISEFGYKSSTEIKVKDFEKIMETIRERGSK